MLSPQDNERLTEVGPGTPMGELMRRYWHPVAPTAELAKKPTKEIRILGEDLVLYKNPAGGYGLVGQRCPHRRVSLAYGIPEAEGLRCMYHGWKFDGTGQCIEAPFEDTTNPEARFRERVKIAGYPVEELGGLLWAYLGPSPAPLLPRWSPFVWPDTVHDIAISILPCNWLQCQENSLDPVHVEWLHTYYTRWQQDQLSPEERDAGRMVTTRRHLKIGFDQFEYGIIKRRVMEGFTEEDDDWKEGHPILFPHTLLVGNAASATMQFRVPIDDEHTYHVSYYTYRAAPGATAPAQKQAPYRYVPLTNEAGDYITDLTFNQDYMCWITQGAIARRDLEKLGESDRGIIMFRNLLKQQIEVVLDGGEPMNVFRDPAQNICLEPPLEHIKFGVRSYRSRYTPAEAGDSQAEADITRVMLTWAERQEAPV